MRGFGGLLSRGRAHKASVEAIEQETQAALAAAMAERTGTKQRGPGGAADGALAAQLAPWLKSLRDEDCDRRTAAAEELAKKGESAVPFLLEVLDDAYGGARASAAYALGKTGDPRAVEPLIAKLQDENESVRSIVVIALSRIADPRAVEPLIAALSDPYVNVRSMAASALLKLDDPSAVPGLIRCLRDEESEVRKTAAAALAKIGDTRAVEPLIERLTAKEKDGEVQLTAILGLGELGDPRAVAPLCQVLKVGDGMCRSVAADALGKLDDIEAVEPLIGILGDSDSVVRRMAAKSLGKLEDPRAVPRLEQTLKDADDKVRNEARQALAALAARGAEQGTESVEPSVPVTPPPAEKPRFKGKTQRGKNTHETYEADDAETAKAFLLAKKVDRPFYYIAVETPEGIWGLDKEGLYLIRLLPWQTDLSLAQCKGSMIEHPTESAVQMVTQMPEVDNVVAKVKCGNCEGEWFDGLRHQELTIVRCPHCRYHNEVDSTGVRFEF